MKNFRSKHHWLSFFHWNPELQTHSRKLKKGNNNGDKDDFSRDPIVFFLKATSRTLSTAVILKFENFL